MFPSKEVNGRRTNGERIMNEQSKTHNELAKFIARKINESGKSNGEIADETGLSYVTVFNLRNQRITMPAAGTIKAISKAVGITKKELEKYIQ